jgi:hypothetical protein
MYKPGVHCFSSIFSTGVSFTYGRTRYLLLFVYRSYVRTGLFLQEAYGFVFFVRPAPLASVQFSGKVAAELTSTILAAFRLT